MIKATCSHKANKIAVEIQDVSGLKELLLELVMLDMAVIATACTNFSLDEVNEIFGEHVKSLFLNYEAGLMLEFTKEYMSDYKK